MSSPPTVKIIAHLDLDSFFVSAERTRRPELLGKPVAVGGTAGRGVISSASYEARAYGVRSAMPVRQAQVLCPPLLLVRGDYALYQSLSRRVFETVARYSPVVEATGIDEGYFDLTGTERLWGDPEETCRRLQREIAEQLGLPCSFGIGANRRIAKIATEDAKPAGVFRVRSGDEPAYLAPKKVRVIPGVGAKTEAWLRSRGIRTVGDLQRFPLETLERHLGSSGRALARAAWGEGSVDFHREAKTPGASRERTFSEDQVGAQAILAELDALARKLATDLRREGMQGRVVKLKIRYSDFQTVTRQRALPFATRDPRVLSDVARTLWQAHSEPRRPVRLLGLGVTLETEAHARAQAQLELFLPELAGGLEDSGLGGAFPDPSVSLEKRERLEFLAETLAERFGAGKVALGAPLKKSE